MTLKIVKCIIKLRKRKKGDEAMQKRLLDAKMVEHGFTNESLAKCLNIDVATLYRKKNGTSDFYRKEIQIIKKILNLSNDDVNTIFFTDELA